MIDYREDARWTVYIHIVPKELGNYPNDKYYVGITSKKPHIRWYSNGGGYSRNFHFWNTIQKYGWNQIQHEIVAENLTHLEANLMEQKLIKLLQSNCNNYGYNNSIGGDGGNHEESQKVLRYDLNGFYIKTYDSASIAERELGVSRGTINKHCKHHTSTREGSLWRYENDKIQYPFIDVNVLDDEITVYEYDKQKQLIDIHSSIKALAISNNIKYDDLRNALLKKKTYKTTDRVYKTSLYKKNKSYKVFQFNLDKSFIKQFNSAVDASIYYDEKYKPKGIRDCCNGTYKTAYGFIWKYETDVIESENISGSFLIVE